MVIADVFPDFVRKNPSPDQSEPGSTGLPLAAAYAKVAPYRQGFVLFLPCFRQMTSASRESAEGKPTLYRLNWKSVSSARCGSGSPAGRMT
jgi:hypothetical protein